MSSSIVSILMILFTQSIFLIFSIPITTAATTPSSLIKEACSSTQQDFDQVLCIQLLESEPKIALATNLFDLSIGIMETGISNATNTRSYIESTLTKTNLDPNLKSALQQCKMSYDSVITSLNSALSEVKNDKEYQTATYDLLLASTDDIAPCKNVVASKGVKDAVVLSGNKVVPIYGISAYDAVNSLSK